MGRLRRRGAREREARASAEAFLGAGGEVIVHGFRDGFLPYVGGEVKDVFEELKRWLDPDLIFTHRRHDLHQDHRLVVRAHLEHVARSPDPRVRDPQVRRRPRHPNVFVPVPEELAREKARLVVEAFETQREKHWFGEDLFLGLMRLRGMEARSPSGYAEAFTCRKLTLRLE